MNTILKNTLATLLFLGTSNLAMAQEEPAKVATLNKAEGTVMVDKGKGFVSSKANAALNEGDRVITLDKSGAEIVFSDGCRTQLKANNMIVIAQNPGCKAAIVAVNGAPAAAGTAATAGSSVSLPQIALPVLAAGAIFAAASNSGSDNTPISAQ